MQLTAYTILLLIIPALIGLYCSIRLLNRHKYINILQLKTEIIQTQKIRINNQSNFYGYVS